MGDERGESIGFEFARVGGERAGRGMGGGMGGGMDIRERCGFSSLMESKIKGENYAVFCFAEKEKYLLFMFMM